MFKSLSISQQVPRICVVKINFASFNTDFDTSISGLKLFHHNYNRR